MADAHVLFFEGFGRAYNCVVNTARTTFLLLLLLQLSLKIFSAFYVVFSSSSFPLAASSAEARLPGQTPLSGTHLTLEQSWWK